MQRNSNWGGVISNASPFVLPPGATQEQVNLHTRSPGRLQSRGGMSLVYPEGTTQASQAIDVFSCPQTGEGSTLLLLTPSGNLETLMSPSGSASAATGFEPSLASGPFETVTNYLWQYVNAGGATNDLVYTFYGGGGAQVDWDYGLSADSNKCLSPTTDIVGGKATLTQVIGVDPDTLCDYDENRR